MLTSMFLIIIVVCHWLTPVISDGFVEEVSCSSDSISIVLNKSDSDVKRWIEDPKAQPVVYVYGHKIRAPCGSALKSSSGGIVSYNVTIPYGKQCDVHLSDLEPNYQTAETTIALEDNHDTDHSKPIRINHIFCLYTRRVQTIRFNDVSSGHEVIASTGGRPKPKVEMLFRSVDGRSVRAAKFGDTVGFYLALSPDKAYHGIMPKECMFSDREDMHSPDAKHLTFVQSNCPVDELNEIIDPLENVNEEVYFTKFKTFRFGNQTTVFAHCTVQVCLNSAECSHKCFHRIDNSTIAERMRMRRSIAAEHQLSTDPDAIREVAVTNVLTILDEQQSLAAMTSGIGTTTESIEQCSIHASASRTVMQLALASITVAGAFALVTIVVLIRKLKSNRKQLQMALPSRAASSCYGGSIGHASSIVYNYPNGDDHRAARFGANTRPIWIQTLTDGC